MTFGEHDLGPEHIDNGYNPEYISHTARENPHEFVYCENAK